MLAALDNHKQGKRPANILIVEDDSDIATAIAAHLTALAHRVRTASNGLEGLRSIAEDPPDVIVLDVEMPILDGPGMIEALAIERAGQPRIPIVLISAAMRIEKIARWVETPYYLRKPFSLVHLEAMVNAALRKD